MKFSYAQDATPINQDEIFNLIPSSVFTQKDLDAFEQNNISEAEQWLFQNRNKKLKLTCEFIQNIHKRMFGLTWKWAGQYRKSNMNIGVDWARIFQDLLFLCDDINYQIDHKVYDIDEISVRFSHRFVFIHPFPNGNGRCSRLISDWLVWKNDRKRFSWGSKGDLINKSKTREIYIKALKLADDNQIEELIKFARS